MEENENTILPFTFLCKFRSLREEYDRRKKVQLIDKQKYNAAQRFVGYPNIETRHKQILFTEQIITILSNQPENSWLRLHPEALVIGEDPVKWIQFLQLLTLQERQALLRAIKMVYAVAHYIEMQLVQRVKTPLLLTLLNEARTVTGKNAISPLLTWESLELTNKFINENLLSCLNDLLVKPKIKDEVWTDFCSFIRTHHELMKTQNQNLFHCAKVGAKIGSEVGKILAITLGMVTMERIVDSKEGRNVVNTGTDVLRSCANALIDQRNIPSIGFMFYGPSIVQALLQWFGGLSLAPIIGFFTVQSLSLLGGATGLSLDLIYHGMRYAVKRLASLDNHGNFEPISGFLRDGSIVFDGIVLCELHELSFDKILPETVPISTQENTQITNPNDSQFFKIEPCVKGFYLIDASPNIPQDQRPQPILITPELVNSPYFKELREKIYAAVSALRNNNTSKIEEIIEDEQSKQLVRIPGKIGTPNSFFSHKLDLGEEKNAIKEFNRTPIITPSINFSQ